MGHTGGRKLRLEVGMGKGNVGTGAMQCGVGEPCKGAKAFKRRVVGVFSEGPVVEKESGVKREAARTVSLPHRPRSSKPVPPVPVPVPLPCLSVSLPNVCVWWGCVCAKSKKKGSQGGGVTHTQK